MICEVRLGKARSQKFADCGHLLKAADLAQQVRATILRHAAAARSNVLVNLAV